MDILLEIVLLGAVVVGFGIIFGRLVDSHLDKVEEEKAEPKRARDEDGRFVADDPSTPKVNEAWEGGKAPKPKKKKTTKKKRAKKTTTKQK